MNFENLSLPETWIKCGGYFSETVHREPHWVLCQGGRIREIQTSPPPVGAPRFYEHETLYLVPLLSDTHVHVYMEPWPLDPKERSKPGSQAFEAEVEDALIRVKRALSQGMGFLRDMGDPHGINLEVRKRLAQSAEPTPELQVPGPGMHRPKKYGRYLGVIKESVAEIKATIDELIERENVDFIKLVTTGIVDFAQKRVKQTPQFTAEEMEELVSYAHSKGRLVAAHCSGTEGLEIAIEGSMDFIEHAYFVTENQINAMITRKLVWTPTFAPVYTQGYHEFCGWPAETRQKIAEILEEHNRKITYAAERNSLIMAGTDSGSPGVEMGTSIRNELACLARSGIAPAALLAMASVTAAKLCHTSHYTGKIEAGSSASFGLYTKAPWDDITHLDTLVSVFHQGKKVGDPIAATTISQT